MTPSEGNGRGVTQTTDQDRTHEDDARPGVGSDPARDKGVAEVEVEDAFLRSVD